MGPGQPLPKAGVGGAGQWGTVLWRTLSPPSLGQSSPDG